MGASGGGGAGFSAGVDQERQQRPPIHQVRWRQARDVGKCGPDVRVGDHLNGFIRKADLSRERSEQRTERFAVDEKIDAVVTQFDKKTRNLSLSIKAREIAEEKRAMADYGSSDSGASLGDILGAALAKKDDGGAADSGG